MYAPNPAPIMPFEFPGSQSLGESAVKGLGDRGSAVILAMHGLLTVGKTLDKALTCTEYIEEGAEIAVITKLATGETRGIPQEKIKEMIQILMSGEHYRQALTIMSPRKAGDFCFRQSSSDIGGAQVRINLACQSCMIACHPLIRIISPHHQSAFSIPSTFASFTPLGKILPIVNQKERDKITPLLRYFA